MTSHKTAALAAAVLALFATASARAGVIGCDASGNKQIAGAVIGGVLGGVIGNNVIRKDQQAGTIVGAGAGAAAGSYVGCEMQKSDAGAPAPRIPSTTQRAPAPRAPAYVSDDRDGWDDRGERPRYSVREEYREEYREAPPPPRGYKRHPHGMPPGQAKKYYGVGERMPVAYVSDRRYIIYEPAQYRLRTPPPGHRWVLNGEDAYLVRIETGLVSQVVRALLY